MTRCGNRAGLWGWRQVNTDSKHRLLCESGGGIIKARLRDENFFLGHWLSGAEGRGEAWPAGILRGLRPRHDTRGRGPLHATHRDSHLEADHLLGVEAECLCHARDGVLGAGVDAHGDRPVHDVVPHDAATHACMRWHCETSLERDMYSHFRPGAMYGNAARGGCLQQGDSRVRTCWCWRCGRPRRRASSCCSWPRGSTASLRSRSCWRSPGSCRAAGLRPSLSVLPSAFTTLRVPHDGLPRPRTLERDHREDGGVVHQHGEAAEGRVHPLEQLGHVLRLGHVGDKRVQRATGRGHPGGKVLGEKQMIEGRTRRAASRQQGQKGRGCRLGGRQSRTHLCSTGLPTQPS